jgi:hypothetical protein
MESMSSLTRKETMINLLSKVLDGTLSSGDAIKAWPDIDDPTDDKTMKNAWHSLYHYNVDVDIRSKEPEYEVQQKAALQSYLDKLRLSLRDDR